MKEKLIGGGFLVQVHGGSQRAVAGTDLWRVRREPMENTDTWCRVCGDGLALDCSNAGATTIVCDVCSFEGFIGAEGDDVRRATQPLGY